jgi:hypothetical protein
VFYDSLAVIATRTGGNDVVNVPEKQPAEAAFKRFCVSDFQRDRPGNPESETLQP